MCGFIGRLSLDQKSIFERDINDSLKLMKHRGPDEQKVEKGSYWDFGFCRLSIFKKKAINITKPFCKKALKVLDSQ